MDGAVVTVDQPKLYQVKKDYGESTPRQVLQVPVTYKNTSDRVVEFGVFAKLSVEMTINGQPAKHYPLSEPPEVTSPEGKLLSGQSQSFDYLFDVPAKGSDVVIAVTNNATRELVFLRMTA